MKFSLVIWGPLLQRAICALPRQERRIRRGKLFQELSGLRAQHQIRGDGRLLGRSFALLYDIKLC